MIYEFEDGLSMILPRALTNRELDTLVLLHGFVVKVKKIGSI